jgi:chaperone required for assembly of F1-ATPase
MWQSILRKRRQKMIENRNLEKGTKLVARYHKQNYNCEVVEVEEGKLRYRLEDGREFKSPSAAGTVSPGKPAMAGCSGL